MTSNQAHIMTGVVHNVDNFFYVICTVGLISTKTHGVVFTYVPHFARKYYVGSNLL